MEADAAAAELPVISRPKFLAANCKLCSDITSGKGIERRTISFMMFLASYESVATAYLLFLAFIASNSFLDPVFVYVGVEIGARFTSSLCFRDVALLL